MPVVLSTRPLALSDGSLISIDAKSAATNGRSVLFVGPHIYEWIDSTAGGVPDVHPVPALGILRDSIGRISLVPIPRSPSGAQFTVLRVASGGRGRWHFLLIAPLGRDTLVRHGLKVDSAAVWYGLFDGRQWHGLTRIAITRDANLDAGESSEIIVTSRRLAFAFSYDRSYTLKSNAPGNQGLVMLTRFTDAGGNGTWRSDTLPTWEGPQSVHLLAEEQGGILVVFNQHYFENHRMHHSTLFSAVYDSRWQRPRIVWEYASSHVNEPLGVARIRGSGGVERAILAWEATVGFGTNVDSLAWAVMDTDGTIHRVAQSMPTGDMLTRPSLIRTSDGGALWVIPSDTAENELRLIYARDTTVEALSPVHLPTTMPTPVAATLSDGTVLVATMSVRFSESTHQPESVTSYLTTLTLKCPVVRQ